MDKTWMDEAKQVSLLSGDTSTKTGCIIVRGNKILSTGRNDIPHGVNDTAERRERPEKYFWTEHAERTAIYRAAAEGTSLRGATAYINWFPCIDCARALVMSGIVRVVGIPVNMDHPKYAEDFKRAQTLFAEAGVEVTLICEEVA